MFRVFLLALVLIRTRDSSLISRETCSRVCLFLCSYGRWTGGSGGVSLIRFVCSSSRSHRFLIPTHTHSVSFFLLVFCFFLYIGDFLTVCMIQLYIYTTPACAISSDQECSCRSERVAWRTMSIAYSMIVLRIRVGCHCGRYN